MHISSNRCISIQFQVYLTLKYLLQSIKCTLPTSRGSLLPIRQEASIGSCMLWSVPPPPPEWSHLRLNLLCYKAFHILSLIFLIWTWQEFGNRFPVLRLSLGPFVNHHAVCRRHTYFHEFTLSLSGKAVIYICWVLFDLLGQEC